MGWVFDTHPADSRVVGPVKVAGCVVARYGTGGGQCTNRDTGSDMPCKHAGKRRNREECCDNAEP